MEKKRNWRIIVLWILVIFSVLYVLPTLVGFDALPGWYKDAFAKKLNYGLDLQGGLELRYTVDWKRAIQDNGTKLGDTIRSMVVDELAKKDNKNAADLPEDEWNQYAEKAKVEIPDYDTIRVVFDSPETASLMDEDLMANADRRYEFSKSDDKTFEWYFPEAQVAQIRAQVVKETRATIQKRVEAFGLVDPDVRGAGENDIVVQIPGVAKQDMDMVRQRIGQTAQLTFRMVDRSSTFITDQRAAMEAYKTANPERSETLQLVPSSNTGAYFRAAKKSELLRFIGTLQVPDDHIVGYELVERKDEFGAITDRFWRTQLLHARAEVTGDHLARAQVFYDQKGFPYVSLDLNAEGGRLFASLTEKNVGEYLAIMLDDEVNSAPVIEEKIGGGRARITMGSGRTPQETLQESQALVTVLNNGAYRAPVYKVQDHEVGPSLGADSVAAGELAMGLGMGIVILFMGLYYRKAGLIAVMVLVLNLLLILMLLVSFNSALTLPGMAGIILTIGMAVDANIIIYERIREELLSGRPPRAAVDAGYEKAWSTILDANVTTALAGFILLNYTSGPIHGFAVTLLMGIASSVFTAVWVSRQMFNWWVNRYRPEELSI